MNRSRKAGWLKTLGIMTVLLLAALPLFGAAAEENAPVTAEEVRAFLNGLRDRAAGTAPLNDPQAEEAKTEDGTAFIYDFATLYAEGTEIKADTEVAAAEVFGSEEPVFRGIMIDDPVNGALAALPVSNADMAGTRDAAVLYLEGGVDGFRWGLAVRDRQRISAVEYGEVVPEGQGFVRAGVMLLVQDDLVTSVRADEAEADAETVQAIWQELTALQEETAYRAVKTSRDGLELEPFGEADLVFDGLDYLNLKPEDLPGLPEDVLVDNEDGTWIRRVLGDGYEAVFTCGEDGSNPVINSLTLTGTDEDGAAELEGPRAVRPGDLFHQDFNRFRHENADSDGITEMLYGTEGTAPWGKATYAGDEGLTLRYVTGTAGGAEVELLLRYTDNRLSEILLHTR